MNPAWRSGGCSYGLVVQLLSRVWLFVTPWTAARQASLSSTISRSLLKFKSIELVVLSNQLWPPGPLRQTFQNSLGHGWTEHPSRTRCRWEAGGSALGSAGWGWGAATGVHQIWAACSVPTPDLKQTDPLVGRALGSQTHTHSSPLLCL